MKVTPLLAVLLLLPAAGTAGPTGLSADLAALIERCLGNGDADELAAAVEQQVGKFVASPRYTRPSGQEPSPEMDRPNRDWLLTELGHSILINAASLSDGLPPVSRFAKPHRLGPLFDGMLPDRFEKDPAALLVPLVPLVTPEWLQAAVACGSYHFVHSVRLLRGEINEVLLEYQQTGNDTGLLLLGASLGTYPRNAAQVRPANFATRTLALLLAGAYGTSRGGGCEADVQLALACARWAALHPGLIEELLRLTPPMSVAFLCPIARLLVRGEREEAARLIQQVPDYYQEPVRQLLVALQGQGEPGAPEGAELAKSSSSKNLIGVLYSMLDINKHDDCEIERALPLMRELLTRRDLPGGPPYLGHSPSLRQTALRWWLAGGESRAFELLRLDFLLERATEPSRDLARVPELARIAGKSAELAAEVDRLAAAWGQQRFSFHRQAMRQVAGQTPIPAAEHCGRAEFAREVKVIDALAGDAATALACYNKLPAAIRFTYQPWLVLTGNAAFPRDLPLNPPVPLTIRLEGNVGGDPDPKGENFRALDAMAKVRSLLENSKPQEARELFVQTLIRCQLDAPQLGDPLEKVTLYFEGTPDMPYGGRGSEGFGCSPQDIVTLAIVCWNLDEPWLRDYVLLEARRGVDGDCYDSIWLPLARYLARHGAYEEARTAALLYQVPADYEKRHKLALLAEVDGLAKAAAGNTAAALLRLTACMELAPNYTAPGQAIIACLAKHGGPGAAAAAQAAIREHWQRRQAVQPDSPGVREAANRWLAILEAP